jgi:hypothetical protein
MLDGVVKTEINLQKSMEEIRATATPAQLEQLGIYWH